MIGVGREPGIGVKKQQYIAGGLGSARIHLQGAAARGRDHVIGAQAGALNGGIAAAAIDHDHLGAERTQIGKCVERGRDTFAFVEHRHDDGELRHGGGHAEFGARSLRRFLQRAAAARALAGGAAVAVAGDADRPAFELDIEQVRQA